MAGIAMERRRLPGQFITTGNSCVLEEPLLEVICEVPRESVARFLRTVALHQARSDRNRLGTEL